ncbi:MAG: DUF2065 domain-containing protein [Gammaproteobacteria bacterium]|nr:DUF2065 domain-containing protein [Gammaproteobacteria bacterium]MYD77615.1 DUF2065 domain-containing protein [Gammaproteobacteria bacterium]MYI89069.1 DUF2065 domain-containing protein [Gammaproteobacteria bacterium]
MSQAADLTNYRDVNVWQVILAAVGLVLVIEGAVYFALPDVSRQLLKRLLETRVGVLRRIGMISVAIGLGLIWLATTL